MADEDKPQDEATGNPESLKDKGNQVSAESKNKDSNTDDFHVAGIGASAGGIDALKKLFGSMPDKTGAAFVVITHLDPNTKSNLDQIIAQHVKIPVQNVEDGMELRPDNIYCSVPNRAVAIQDGKLYLMQDHEHVRKSPINYFFKSLADEMGELSVGIILSGTGTDGTLGIKKIKERLGLVIVEEPEAARFKGMPESAIATDIVDFVVDADQIASKLLEYIDRRSQRRISRDASERTLPEDAVNKILYVIRSNTGHDFSGYKKNTIHRRINRRLDVQQIDDIDKYIRYLQENSAEIRTLFKDMLIGVTGFFRDRESYHHLHEKVFPMIVRDKEPGNEIRIWVAATATGEEAYSIAIALREFLDDNQVDFNVQIFATDIDNDSIEIARRGVYPLGIEDDIGKQRLRRFFEKSDRHYKVKREIREMIVFAEQNTIKDPPFINMDLITCRNFLIYLNNEMQKKIIPLFHYSLKPGGILFLGSSESIGEYIDLFSTVDSKWKIYQRKGHTHEYPGGTRMIYERPEYNHESKKKTETHKDVGHFAEKILLDSYAPPCVITDSDGEIIYIHGRTGKYLEPAQGEASMNVIEMSRTGLKKPLKQAMQEVGESKDIAVRKNVRISINGDFHYINLSVKPFRIAAQDSGRLLIIFEDVPSPKSTKETKEKQPRSSDPEKRAFELEQELERTREDLQTTVEELETSNEELKSMNEEYQSTNEELKSANEELETSREELQSLNEELTTVNSELQEKISSYSRIYENMKIFLDSLSIPIIFLDSDFCVVRFSESANEIVHLIKTDVGRPIQHLTTNLTDVDILEKSSRVLETLRHEEKEVRTKDGHWYLMRVLPYKTADTGLEGVVLSFINIDELKSADRELRDTRTAMKYAEDVINTVQIPLAVVDNDLKVNSTNSTFEQWFMISSEEARGRSLFELGSKEWGFPELEKKLKTLPENKRPIEGFEFEAEFPRIGSRKIMLSARAMPISDHGNYILISMQDVNKTD